MSSKVWLDAGHGGKDVGAVGNGMHESKVALDIVLQIGAILVNHGVQVGYSRTTDVFVELSNRAKKANEYKADLFVSIHCNAVDNPTARGFEVFSFPNATGGARASKAIHDAVTSSKIYTVDRGMKTANFAVLRETVMDAVLVETAFITNPQDAIILSASRDRMAVAIAKGILQFMGIAYKNPAPPEKPIEAVRPADVRKHWVDPVVAELETEYGISFSDKRYDSPATRAEVMTMMLKVLKAKKV